MTIPALFQPLKVKSITLRNRIGVSPMCMYSSKEGAMNDWHMVHLGSRAVGGAALIIAEATAVAPEGRITPGCTGIWDDRHIEPLRRVNAFIKSQGAVAAIQIAHAGRKASAALPWNGNQHLEDSKGGWPTLAPSAVAFGDYLQKVPSEMTIADIKRVVFNFAQAAKRASDAGIEWLEIHSAHGYLSHEFLSPLSNKRTDEYGGSFENRIRFTLELTRAVRKAWPDRLPLTIRISATDWVPGGWDLEQSVELVKILKKEGVDLIDCSSGGIVPDAKIPSGPNFQVPFSERIRREADILTAAVGFITTPQQANEIIETGQADIVLLAREMLRNPYWPVIAAKALGCEPSLQTPKQYARAW